MAQRRRCIGGRRAEWPADVDRLHGRRSVTRRGRCARQRRGDVLQQRRCRVGAEEAGIGCTVRPAHPDAERMAAGHADCPGIAKTEAGAGLPGQRHTATAFDERAVRMAATFQNVAHDPRRAFAHQARFRSRCVRREPRRPCQAAGSQRAVGTDKFFQRDARATEDEAQIGLLAGGHAQLEAARGKPRSKARRRDLVQQVDGRYIERALQRFGGADRSRKIGLEIARLVAAEGLRCVDQQAFGMDEALVQRHRIQERLQCGAGRANAAHHVDVGAASGVGEIGRTGVGAHLQCVDIHHQCGDRHFRRQHRGAVGQQALDRALQFAVQRAGETGQAAPVRAAHLPAQTFGRQRCQPAALQALRDDRLDARVGHHLGRPDAEAGQARQNAITRDLRRLRRAVRTQAAGGTRQRGEQSRFGMAQVARRLAEVGATGHLYAFDDATHRRVIQIQREDVVLRQPPFELQRARHLAQLSARRARHRFEDACDLHGERGAAGHDATAARPLPRSARQRSRIDARMPAEPAVFIAQQRLDVARRHVGQRDRIAPCAIRTRPGTQRAAVAREHDETVVRAGQRRRKQAIEQPQGAEDNQ